ncbi:hypothetical protein IAT38_003293 [Cryptococcus sp. DSM 104549]
MLLSKLFEPLLPLLPAFLSPATPYPLRGLNLVPLPVSSQTGSGLTPICLSADFHIVFADDISGTGFAPPVDLQSAARRAEARVKATRARWLSPLGGEEFFPKGPGKCAHHLKVLRVHLDHFTGASIFDEATLLVEERIDKEAYTLDIPLKGEATIRARGALGAFRGLTSFEGVFYTLGGEVYAPHAPYKIEDKPAFEWRAVLLDTSRNYFSVPSLLKILDTMATVKLNVFHWHITDSNSWPLDLAAYPELARLGAYSPSEVYTEADVRMIVQYAGERGIDVLLELDTPGHTASIAPSHPSHVACFEATPFKSFAHQPPAGQLRFADKAVTAWTAGLLESVAGLGAGKYFSTGGDEINMNCMLTDKHTTASLKANNWSIDDALDHFTAVTHAPIRKAGKTPVVWQEMVLDHGKMPSLGNDTIVDIWVNSADARRVLDKGYRIVHASADYFYLDCGQGGWIGMEGGGDSWCDPLKSWARMYSFDPYQGVKDDERHLIVGGQTSLWAEQTDETNLEPTLWPRAAALAEVFWSGPSADGKPRSSIAALPRMHDIRYRMVAQGVRAAPLQPHWCALRPDTCVIRE